MMKLGQNTYRFLLIYFLSYISFSFCMSNFTPFLSSLGYDAMQRGIMISGYALTTILFQLLFGYLSDYNQKMKRFIIIAFIGFGASSLLLFQDTRQMFALQFVFVALSGGLLNSLCGLLDTWVLGINESTRKNLSFIKAFGSIGWAVGSVLASYIVLYFSYQGLGVSLIILVILSVVNLFGLSDIQQTKSKEKISFHDIVSLFKIREYQLLVFILFLLYAMIVANNCTVIDKMLSLGANNFEISLKWSLGSLLEIPTYLFGAYLLRRIKAIHLLGFSAIVLIIQFLLFAFVKTSMNMVYISVLQVFTTPLVLITSKFLIYELSPNQLKNSSQLIALSIFMGVSSLAMPSVAGVFSTLVGFNTTLILVAGLGVFAFLLIIILERKL